MRQTEESAIQKSLKPTLPIVVVRSKWTGQCYIAVLLFSWVCLFAVICGIGFPESAHSEEPPPVGRVYSIVEDEDGGKLYMPSFISFDPVMNEVYVIDGKGQIVIYTSDFFPLFTLGERNGMTSPQGVAIDRAGNLYVSQAGTKKGQRHKIVVLNACLRPMQEIFFEGFEGAESFVPNRLALGSQGQLFVAGSRFPGILVMNTEGKVLRVISPEEDGSKVNISNITLDRTGRIYLVSEELSHIYVYEEGGKFLFKFGEKGGSSGKLSRPMAAAVDDNSGQIYVVDYMRHAVSIYSRDGKYLSEFGGLGWAAGWFQYPRDIIVDSAGRIFVADTFNHRVEVFTASAKKTAGNTGAENRL